VLQQLNKALPPLRSSGRQNQEVESGTGFLYIRVMPDKNYTGLIPQQHEGAIITAETVAHSNDEQEARQVFAKARERLLDVNNWNHVAGKLLADFQLTDKSGRPVEGTVDKGLHFKIDVPGPGSKAGEGFDWVSVEAVEEIRNPDVESVAIRVRPSSNPATPGDETAHFYSKESTSTFTVTREKNKVTAAVYDRNTKANKSSESVGDKIRNTVVGTAAIMEFSKLQWKRLTDGLLAE
jgi:hypothetical protein